MFSQSTKAERYTKGQLNDFWEAILMKLASKNAPQKFTRILIVPSNAKIRPDGYTYYAHRTHFFVDNMISPNDFGNKFVRFFGTFGYWLENCGSWFATFFFLKLIIDIIATVIRALEKHHTTGKSVKFGKVLLSATYSPIRLSSLNSIFSPTKAIDYSTPAATEMQESTKHIYFSIQTQPDSAPNTVLPVSKKTFCIFYFCVMTQENYPQSDLDLLSSKNNITEEDLLQLRDLIFEEPKTSPIRNLLT